MYETGLTGVGMNQHNKVRFERYKQKKRYENVLLRGSIESGYLQFKSGSDAFCFGVEMLNCTKNIIGNQVQHTKQK